MDTHNQWGYSSQWPAWADTAEKWYNVPPPFPEMRTTPFTLYPYHLDAFSYVPVPITAKKVYCTLHLLNHCWSLWGMVVLYLQCPTAAASHPLLYVPRKAVRVVTWTHPPPTPTVTIMKLTCKWTHCVILWVCLFVVNTIPHAAG